MLKNIYIDADPIIYEIGFVFQSTWYDVLIKDKKTGDIFDMAWEDGNEKLAYFRANNHLEVLSEDIVTEAQPIQNALKGVRMKVASIVNEIANHLKTDPGDMQYWLFISGHENFRNKIATRRGYKASRKDKPRPVHYQAIKDYMIKQFDCRITDGIEADDAVSIQNGNIPGVVATIDKDLDQIPGWHYNYDKKVFYHISKEEAMQFFYAQAAAGDPTDDIPGAYFVGMGKAEKAISEAMESIDEDIQDTPIDYPIGMDTIEERLWHTVLDLYRTGLNRKGCPYTEEEIPKVALETARLVKILEYDDQLWTPPGQPDEVIEWQ